MSTRGDLASLIQLHQGETPAYRQIADQIAQLIRHGDLAPGERLPPDRLLARQLGLSRTTVMAAYDELKTADLIHGRQGSGTFVKRSHSPEHGWSNLPIRSAATRRDHVETTDGILSLSYSLPPLEALPLTTLMGMLSDVARRQPAVLAEYQPAEGYPPLRYALTRQLATWGWPVRPAEVMMTSGAQQGIDLLARLLLQPGDYVAIEQHTYIGALSVFRAAGARLLPIEVDDQGMVIESLTSLLARYPVRLIYTVPTYQNPTGATLPLDRRLALLAAAARQSVWIIEDNPFEQIYFDEPPPPSLKTLDQVGLVLSLASASKLLGAGLRLGWLVAPPAVIEQVATIKRAADLQTNNLAQVALHRCLIDNVLEPHLANLRQICRQRAVHLVAALRRQLPELALRQPGGGLYLWGRFGEGLSSEAIFDEALVQGVAFMPGSWFAVNGTDDGSVRLCFSSQPAARTDEAVSRLVAAVRQVVARGSLRTRTTLASQPPLV